MLLLQILVRGLREQKPKLGPAPPRGWAILYQPDLRWLQPPLLQQPIVEHIKDGAHHK